VTVVAVMLPPHGDESVGKPLLLIGNAEVFSSP
jgi:hypothetical protein